MPETKIPGGPGGPGDQPGSGAPGAPEKEELRQLALERVARWWPNGLKRCDPEPETVSFTREAVRAWGPPKPREASQALATCFRYSTWRIDQGLELTPGAFSLDDVRAYLAGPLADSPRATRRSARTYLRRLDAARCQPDPGETTEATSRRPSQPEPVAVATAIAQAIATHVPAKLDPTRFARVEVLVRDAVCALAPASPTRARDALTWAAYLAAWADDEGHVLRSDDLFHPDTVEDYLAALLSAGVDEHTVGAQAGLLRSVARARNPRLRPHKRTIVPKQRSDDPYSPSEVAELLALAERASTSLRRRRGRALIALELGTGAFPAEAVRAQPSHVHRNDDGRLVAELHQSDGSTRIVVVVPEYEALLQGVVEAAVAAGDTYLLGGVGPTKNKLSDTIADMNATDWDVPLSTARLRTSFLVALCAQEHSVLDLLEQAGVATLNALERILPYLRTDAGASAMSAIEGCVEPAAHGPGAPETQALDLAS